MLLWDRENKNDNILKREAQEIRWSDVLVLIIELPFTRYLTAKVIIPESMKSIGEFYYAKFYRQADRLTLVIEKLSS